MTKDFGIIRFYIFVIVYFVYLSIPQELFVYKTDNMIIGLFDVSSQLLFIKSDLIKI